MRRALVIAPLGCLLALWVATLFASWTIAFGIPPYDYEIEMLRGTLTIEKVYSCVRARPLKIAMETPQPFDKDFYRNWQRTSNREESWGIFSCNISYALSSETKQLDPRDTVTPATLVAIPYWHLLLLTTFPVLITFLWRYWTANRKTPNFPQPALRAAD
jgi:hypothetical protein